MSEHSSEPARAGADVPPSDPADPEAGAVAERPRSDRSPWLWLLLVPLVMTLIPPIYNRRDPELLGFPFFYWWQFLAAVVAVLVTVVVYRRTER